MLILGPAASPTMSAVTWYRPTSAGSLMTRSPSTTSRAGSVMLEPTSPGSLSTVTTSSSATFSCLPPQRTIAYTRELSLPLRFLACLGTPVSPRRARLNVHPGPAQAGYSPTAKATRRQCLYEPRSFGCLTGLSDYTPPLLSDLAGKIWPMRRIWYLLEYQILRITRNFQDLSNSRDTHAIDAAC